MELRVLRYFLAVAREGSISRAANFLHLTQPTLSRQLMDLEDELGKNLIIRGNRKITLTDDGMLLRKRASEIIELTDKTKAEFASPDDTINGDVYIGGGETDAMRMIARIANDLQSRNHQIHYHLYSGNADDVTERLDKGLLDFGVLIGLADVEKYEHIKLPVHDSWGLLMKKDSPLAAFDTISPEQVWNLPLITSRQSMVGSEISSWLKKDYDQLDIVATYNLVFNASLMVEEGLGYALCLNGLLNTTGKSRLTFRPLCPKLDVSLNIVWKKYQVFSKASQLFLDKLREKLS